MRPRRLATLGPNEVDHEKPLPWWRHLWQCYRNPFNLLLTVLAAVSWLTEDIKATIVIGAMVLLSTLIRFVQEGRSNRAAERLKALVGNTARVLRRNPGTEAADVADQYFGAHLHSRRPARLLDLPIRELVPGDHIVLSAGDMIPADCRVLTAKDLFVAQAAMTGESLPVEKFAHPGDGLAGLLEQHNLLFMGTNVVSGTATAVVLATGNRTYFGTLAQRSTATDRAPTAFQAGVNSVSWLLIRFALVMVPFVLLINGWTKGDWTEAFLFALSVAVGLTPEMLPMIVTSTLAKGAVLLSRRKVIVKRLDAIQNFGAMEVLCTDKTGTLTQDRSRWSATPMCSARFGRRAEVRLPQQPLPDRADQPAGPCGAGARGAAEFAAAVAGLPQGGRDPVRLRAPPHVGGGVRARGPP
jgi:Mg2+-importing ATPase